MKFKDVIRFPPARTNDVVVIRLPRNPSLALLEHLVGQFLESVAHMPVEKRLWIVEIGLSCSSPARARPKSSPGAWQRLSAPGRSHAGGPLRRR